MKWKTINPDKPGNDHYSGVDTGAAFALENGLVLRGNNLPWYQSTPG
jgi:GH35 family endo-1,4-beta-xylanase